MSGNHRYLKMSPLNCRAYPAADTLSASILRCLRDGAVGPTEIGDMLGISKGRAAALLDLLKCRGLALNVYYGHWELLSPDTTIRVYGERYSWPRRNGEEV